MDEISKRILERRALEKNKQQQVAIKKQLSYQKWYKEWSKRGNKKRSELRKTNPTVYLNDRVNTFIYLSIKAKLNGKTYRGWKWEKWVGYTLDDLMTHLEKQFNCFMNWDNYGKYWVIDHYIPRKYFKFNSVDDEEFKRCWALENLRPLEKSKNYYNHLKKEIDTRLKSLKKMNKKTVQNSTCQRLF
ncbi:MAG: hypothetical protein ACP5HC_06435 [Caldisericum sp.]